jgi:hypothetical protein
MRTPFLSGLLLPAAFFIFLAAAARTGIVPADFRLVAAKGWNRNRMTIDKSPGSGFFAEGRGRFSCADIEVCQRFVDKQ